jgi:hypothetical protein
MFYSDIVKSSELIVTGTALGSECRLEEGGKTIRTYVTFGNLAAHKGNPGATLVLRLEGGTVGDDRLVIADLPAFRTGSRYLLYVAGNGTAISPIVGFHQGAFEVVERDGREVLLSLKGLELIGVEGDRFVFAGKPEPKDRRSEHPGASSVPGFTPRLADPDCEQKELEMLRARAAVSTRALAQAPLPVTTSQSLTGSVPPEPKPDAKVGIGVLADPTPVVVPVERDHGIRASAASLLSTPVVEGRK